MGERFFRGIPSFFWHNICYALPDLNKKMDVVFNLIVFGALSLQRVIDFYSTDSDAVPVLPDPDDLQHQKGFILSATFSRF
jgi:hypothetical protein